MSHEIDLSFLDLPEILELVFPLAYSNFYFSSCSQPPSYMEIAEGTRIGYGLWRKSRSSPTILYFHGNGETPGDYSEIANFYNQRNINLFVASYRGYGLSTGSPTITSLLRDSHSILREFKKIIEKEGFEKKLFLMGRSLGSIPAMELAYHHQMEFSGIIIESGLANNFRRWWRYLKPRDREFILNENGEFLNKVKARAIKIPALIIHGEYDSIIPYSEGKELYENLASKDKKLLIIPGADHNDLMTELYFKAIEEFIAKV
ncbi:MAG: alpha/beta hydrolase [Methanocellales archaeon]